MKKVTIRNIGNEIQSMIDFFIDSGLYTDNEAINLSIYVNKNLYRYQRDNYFFDFTTENIYLLLNQYCDKIDSQSTQLLFKSAIIKIKDYDKGIISIICPSRRSKDVIQRDRKLKDFLIENLNKKDLLIDIQLSHNLKKWQLPNNQVELPKIIRDEY